MPRVPVPHVPVPRVGSCSPHRRRALPPSHRVPREDAGPELGGSYPAPLRAGRGEGHESRSWFCDTLGTRVSPGEPGDTCVETMGGHVYGESFCTDHSELTGNRCWPQIRLVCSVTQQPRDPKHRLGAGNWSLGRVLLTPLKPPFPVCTPGVALLTRSPGYKCGTP